MSKKDFEPTFNPPELPAPFRKATDFLPGYLQTDLLKKFFGITVDQWFQPPQQETVSGFIGEKGGLYYKPDTDFYLNEPTPDRNHYQLEPTVVSVDNLNNTNFVEFYQDMINSLKFDGALVNNHSRLFAENFYSWGPPINPDMFVNFTNYFWVQMGPQAHVITDPVTAVLDIVGQKNYTTASGLELQSGMRVIFTQDSNYEYNNKAFIVENVGSSIVLIDDSGFDESALYDVAGYDTTPYDDVIRGERANYFTIHRASQDKNPWSRTNRWFHRDVLGDLDLSSGSVFEQAKRPIIEFVQNIELNNFARYGRNDVTVLSTSDQILNIVGQSSYTIDGRQLLDGDTVLFTGESDPSKNNRVYEVFGITDFGAIGLTLVFDGLDNSGAPVEGEGVKILRGNSNANKQLYFNGTAWVEGQNKYTHNQAPLFNLYDLKGVDLNDEVEYPNNNFSGSQIFAYVQSGSTLDPYLDIPVQFATFGDIQFNNLLSTQRFSYTENGTTAQIGGYYFYKIFETKENLGEDRLINDWYTSKFESRQTVMNRFTINEIVSDLGTIDYPRNFELSITPDANVPSAPFNYRVLLNGVVLQDTVDYDVVDDKLELSLTLSLSNGDVVEAETWAEIIPEVTGDGYFQIPTNLSSNPNNEQIGLCSFNQISPQFASIIENQTGFSGNANGINNFKDTERDLSRGTLILNHTASLLRMALLLGNVNTKLTDSIRYSNRYYNIFKGKFNYKIQDLALQNFTNLTPASSWVAEALKQINVGKTEDFPFANSAMTSGNNYIPSTPAALGVTGVYKPEIYLDTTRTTPTLVIQGHDGSLTVATGDYRDQVILELENQIYDAIDPVYQNPERQNIFDILTLRPGYYRTTDYSRKEWLEVSMPAFERWSVYNQIDYVTNRSYDSGNAFTWNYSNTTLPNGEMAPGSWRGIYMYMFDTDRPHTHPWEMLGFTQKPAWFDAQYGTAPYSSNNLVLWQDLQDGIIRQGERAGTYEHLARPSLISTLPVDASGNLLDPIASGAVSSTPNAIDARANWKFGDIGPGEYNWKISSSYPYDLAESMFLTKPAKFVDLFWEARKESISFDQLYDIDLGRRFTSEDLTVHNEILDNGSRAVVKGISNWVSDFVTSKSLNLKENFGDLVRELTVKLAYKTGAFVKSNNLRMTSDSIGLIPNENINVKLYKSASFRQPVYSGVIVIWDGSTYRVCGYDSIAQKFVIIPGQPNGKKSTIQVGNVSVSRYDTPYKNTQDVTYYASLPTREAVVNFLVGYQRYLESQGWVFDDYDYLNNNPKDFNTAAKQFLQWSQVQLTAGDSIILSPVSDKLVLQVDHGQVENVQGFVNGVYGILDRTGFGIAANQFTVDRNENNFTLSVNSDAVQGVYCLRLSVVEFEHALVLDNQTKFNDTIYNPVLGIRQPRFRLFENRTKFWNGKPVALGFIVQEDNLIDNFETSVENFRRFYDFDWKPATGIQGQLAKHTIGYQERDYIQGLLLDTNTEFEFYRGFIRDKGTHPSFENVLRSSYVTQTADFNVLEEWAFLIGEYGSLEKKSGIELKALQSQFFTNPQLVEFVNSQGSDPTHIDILPNDPRWVLKRKNNLTNDQFSYRNFVNRYRKDLPNAGYVMIGETTFTVTKETGLLDLFNNVLFDQEQLFSDGQTLWTILMNNGDWSVRRICEQPKVSIITDGATFGDPTTITLEANHQIQIGDTVFIQQTTETSPDLIGIHTVLDVPSSTSFTIEDTITTPAAGTYPLAPGTGQNILVLKSVRFATIADRDAFTPLNGWIVEDRVFVDNNGNNRWEVFAWDGSAWNSVRVEEDKINIDDVYNVFVYDSITNIDVAELELFDPYKGLIFSSADREIYYKTDYDPAKYTDGDAEVYQIDPEQAWTSKQVGRLWWNLSTTRFIDYEQSSYDYRRKNWGKVAPGIEVEVYEWVQSAVVPSSWDSYVASLSDTGDNRPSGTPIYGQDTPYVTEQRYNVAKNTMENVYYFWVKLPNTVPAKDFRKISAMEVASLIQNSSAQLIPWFAPISQDAFIASNLQFTINDESSVLQITFYEDEDNSAIHKQWKLLREQDTVTAPYVPLWNKMRDSLVGYDDLNNTVPDPSLSVVERYGNKIRPRQTWFVDMYEARKEFFEKANKILNEKNTVEILGWNTIIDQQQPEPEITEYDYKVDTRADRNALENNIFAGKKVLVETDELEDNYWTLWQYGGGSSWVLLEKQLYKSEDYYTRIDWYEEGFSPSTRIVQTYADIPARNADISSINDGEVVKVLNNGAGVWTLYVLSHQNGIPTYTMVAEQDGTIAFDLSIADFNKEDSYLVDQTAAVTKIFIKALKDNLLTILEQNQIFFSMVHYVHSEQTIVPWVFKTSLVLGEGNQLELNQNYISSQDQTNNLIDYFNEAKPYHVKLRSLTEQRTLQMDTLNIHIDETRFMDITLIFDRVSITTNIPEGANPKDYDISKLNAADRIQLFYQPSEGMPPKVLASLISRGEFGGTVVDGKNFYQFGAAVAAGYDAQPYDEDYAGGYDFAPEDIENYYDAFVNGGQKIKFKGPLADVQIKNAGSGYTIADTLTIVPSDQLLPDFTASGGSLSIGSVGLNGEILSVIIDSVGVDYRFNNQVTVSSSTGSGAVIYVNPHSFDQVIETDSTINVEGNQFIQPWLDADHPEELVKVRAGDAFILDVYTSDTRRNLQAGYDVEVYDEAGYDFSGSDLPVAFLKHPKLIVKRVIGAVGGTDTSAKPISLGQLPQNKDAVIVHYNGTLLKPSDYSINWNDLTVDVGIIAEGDVVIVNSFGAGGNKILKKKSWKNTSNTTFDTKVEIGSPADVFASVDGNIASFTVSGSSVTITSPLPSSSTVLVVVFAGSSFSTITTQREVASGTSHVMTLPTDRAPASTAPAYISTYVYNNGLRLTPHPMKLYTSVAGEPYYKTVVTPPAPSTVKVWEDGIEQVVGSGFLRFFITGFKITNGGSGYTVGDTVTISGDGFNATAEVNTVNGSGKILSIMITDQGYDYTSATATVSGSGTGASVVPVIATDDVRLLNPALGGQRVLVVVEAGGEYTITGTDNEIITVLSTVSGDEIDVTTYTDDITYGMQTETFAGSDRSSYPIGGIPFNTNNIFVYVNGEIKTFGKDFKLVDDELGYDSEFDGYDVGGFDANSSLSVKFAEHSHTDSDDIIVTYIENLPAEDTVGFRIYKNIFGNYEYFRISDENSTLLVADLLSTDKEIIVEDATVLGQPDVATNKPGVIFINGERITFWAVDTSVTGQHVLQQCLRGTGGTGINIDLPVGTVVRDASEMQKIPGGYNWEAAPNGLLYSESMQARFLKEKPGSESFGE